MIADLLARARQSHLDAKRARAQGRVDDHFQSIRDALEARTQAHSEDPDHLDQAWSTERTLKFDHEACLQFYTAELAKDVATERVTAQSRLLKAQEVVRESLKNVGRPANVEVTH